MFKALDTSNYEMLSDPIQKKNQNHWHASGMNTFERVRLGGLLGF